MQSRFEVGEAQDDFLAGPLLPRDEADSLEADERSEDVGDFSLGGVGRNALNIDSLGCILRHWQNLAFGRDLGRSAAGLRQVDSFIMLKHRPNFLNHLQSVLLCRLTGSRLLLPVFPLDPGLALTLALKLSRKTRYIVEAHLGLPGEQRSLAGKEHLVVANVGNV